MKNGPYELVVAPSGYPGKLYRNRYCYEHHLVWWQNTGCIPGEGEQVHHKDGNKRHNVFDNLEMKTASEHLSMHGRKRGRIMIELRCPSCKNVFVRRKNETFLVKKDNHMTFCSRQCEGRYAFSRKKKQGFDTTEDIRSNIIREFHLIPA